MKALFCFAVLFLVSEAVHSIPLPGTPAPDFNATIVKPDNSDPAGIIVNDFQLSSLFGKKRIMLFAYPKNCTFICPTELIALNKKLDEFRKLGAAGTVTGSKYLVEVHDKKILVVCGLWSVSGGKKLSSYELATPACCARQA